MWGYGILIDLFELIDNTEYCRLVGLVSDDDSDNQADQKSNFAQVHKDVIKSILNTSIDDDVRTLVSAGQVPGDRNREIDDQRDVRRSEDELALDYNPTLLTLLPVGRMYSLNTLTTENWFTDENSDKQ